jgi:hypothetical protein
MFHSAVMKYPKYPIVTGDNPYIYMFYSEGPRGQIRKGVFYTQIGRNLFNLGFGDLKENLRDLDDASRTNNGDRDKVLATVAASAIYFTEHFPNARIFIEGSTSARTRLYQMGISSNLLEINVNFEVMGFLNENWEPFQSGRNYEAFLIGRK